MDLVVGRVVKAHGVTGEVVVDVRTDEPEARFAPGGTLRARPSRGGSERRLVVDGVRPHGGRLLVRLSGVVNRDDADALRGMLFLVEAAELPPIEDADEFYDHQLEGLSVRTVDGTVIGVVAEVLHTAAGELLAVRRDDGSEALVPFVQAIVTAVALADGIVEIDPPDGLLELE